MGVFPRKRSERHLTKPARLDADGKAKPLTKLYRKHIPIGVCSDYTAVDTYVGADGEVSLNTKEGE